MLKIGNCSINYVDSSGIVIQDCSLNINHKNITDVAGIHYSDGHLTTATLAGDFAINTTNHFAVHTSLAQNAFFVTNAGNVGIGTTDPSAALDVSGDIYMNGSEISGVRWTTFNNGAYIDASNSSSGDLYIESGGPSKFVHVESVRHKSNVIYNIGKVTYNNGSITHPSICWSNGNDQLLNHHTGFYQPGGNQGKAVGITCSGEKIATFWHQEPSGGDISGGIQFYRDVSMNHHSIGDVSRIYFSDGTNVIGSFHAMEASGITIDCSLNMAGHNILDVSCIIFSNNAGSLCHGSSLDIIGGKGHNIQFMVDGEKEAMIIDSATGDVKIRKNIQLRRGDKAIALAAPDSITTSHTIKFPGQMGKAGDVLCLSKLNGTVKELAWDTPSSGGGGGGANGADGAKGDTGATGTAGVKGDTGDTGAAGAKGDSGAAGADGKDGSAGAKGDTGAAGAAGTDGAAGAKGDTGAAGAAGTDGAAGAKGDTGATGAAGTDGAAGAKGDTGAAGAKGDTGAAGAKGDTGAAGAKGDTGAAGAAGTDGAAGAKGDTGAAGAAGTDGAAGAKGDTGAAGAAGTDGAAGAAGAAGTDGAAGAKGDTGAAGAKGDTGAVGAKGDTGAAGAAGTDGAAGAKGDTGAAGAAGTDGAAGAKGDTGAAGAKGDTGATGAAGTDGAAGAKGDTGAAGAAGTDGAAGAKGDTGAAGAKGDTGAAGAKGDTGAAGAAGTDGAAGAKGNTGATGAKGDSGASGADGKDGSAGAKGDTGAAGAAGTDGAAGAKGDTGAAGAAGTDGAAGAQGATGAAGTTVYDFIVACSDETTALVVNNAAVSFTAPRAFILVGVSAYLKTAGSEVTTLDIVAKGKVVNTSAISFQAGEKGYKELPNNINLVVEKGTELVIRITAAGASAAGLKYNLRGTL